jgi:hypothetical protein
VAGERHSGCCSAVHAPVQKCDNLTNHVWGASVYHGHVGADLCPLDLTAGADQLVRSRYFSVPNK